jgi:uncharacterized membrane protein
MDDRSQRRKAATEGGPNEAVVLTLKVGVAVSFTLLLAGLLWTLALSLPSGKMPAQTVRDPNSGMLYPNTLLLHAGLLALMATPILRVIAALRYFWLHRDARYSLISAAVLLVILASILISIFHF